MHHIILDKVGHQPRSSFGGDLGRKYWEVMIFGDPLLETCYYWAMNGWQTVLAEIVRILYFTWEQFSCRSLEGGAVTLWPWRWKPPSHLGLASRSQRCVLFPLILVIPPGYIEKEWWKTEPITETLLQDAFKSKDKRTFSKYSLGIKHFTSIFLIDFNSMI